MTKDELPKKKELEKPDDQVEQPEDEKTKKREPATVDEEKEVEKEELESFRRRRQWFEEVLGDAQEEDPD